MRIPGSETACKSSLKGALERNGFYVLNTENRKSPANPDLYVCKEGQACWIEGKRIKQSEAIKILAGDTKTMQYCKIRNLNRQMIGAVYAIWCPDVREPLSNFFVGRAGRVLIAMRWAPLKAAAALEDLICRNKPQVPEEE